MNDCQISNLRLINNFNKHFLVFFACNAIVLQYDLNDITEEREK